ncbi:tetratricopeptide repeat protein [Chamaesiphon sp. VAR_48_metabat_135_sub]|uniref:tetratricopeptide repeat protein n=1 Tax=Chamaesiphon sp. VAR_48_metabat_135_sub TaxID=2964699 RepID=UPI00286B4F93|nr:tetratricopeptide repeat protein [Chamaesiphon sp. VAR_48_metabat_135_sub]
MNQDYYQQGLVKAKAGDNRGAIADFDFALIATPEWAEVYYRRGLAYFDLGELVTAVADYTQALTFDAHHKDCYYARALARLTLKNFPGALEDVDRSILSGRDYAPAYQLKGLICKKLTQYPAAIAAYKIAANLYLAQQDSINSRQCLELAQSLQPKPIDHSGSPISTIAPLPLITSEQFYTQLLEQGERGDLPGAIDNANWAVKTSPNDVRSYTCRGILYLKQGDRSAALADFSRAIQIDPEFHVAYRSRGKLRDKMGDYRGAILDFDRAIALNSQDLFIYLARGNVRVSLNDYNAAIADFDRAIEIDLQEPLAYIHRAKTYTKIEELERAIADYQIAANIYLERQNLPKYQETLTQLQQIQRSTPKSSPPPTTDRSRPQNEALRQRLFVLVSGHWGIAQRLIDRLKEDEPGYDEDWYLDRVIDNLERGR